MEKGKYGIRFSFYAVMAFIFAVLGFTTALFLLAGVVMIAEKDEWASRQVIQAVCLALVNSVAGIFFDFFDFIYKIPFINTLWGTFTGIVEGILSLFVLIFAIIGLIKVAKGKEAGIPLADKFANWAYARVS